MFSIFKSNRKVKVSFSDFSQQDMHSHLLPGIDDGAVDVETALSLINGMKQTGIRHFIGTPHIMSDVHKNDRRTITAAYLALKEKFEEHVPEGTLSFAAEYMIDDGFINHLISKDMLTLYDNKLLVETPFYKEPIDIEEVLFQIETSGYSALLAHPERYHYVDEKLKVFDKYLDRGMDLQLNMLSLSGYYGSREKEVAEKILNAGLYRFIGTDLHHERHLKRLETMILDKKIIKKIEQTDWKNDQITVFHRAS